MTGRAALGAALLIVAPALAVALPSPGGGERAARARLAALGPSIDERLAAGRRGPAREAPRLLAALDDPTRDPTRAGAAADALAALAADPDARWLLRWHDAPGALIAALGRDPALDARLSAALEALSGVRLAGRGAWADRWAAERAAWEDALARDEAARDALVARLAR